MMNARKQADKVATLVFAGCAVLLLGMAGLAMVARSNRVEAAAGLGGEASRPPKGTMLVILDKTDPMTSQEQQAVTERVRSLARHELRKGERLSIWAIGDHEDGTLSKEFCLTSPGFTANGLTDNARMVRARFDSSFARPVDATLADVTRRETAATSPIMESLREVGELKEFVDVQGPRRILIVSDMLQHSRVYSQYGSARDFAALRRLPAWRELRAGLEGVSVEIVYLHRPRDARYQDAFHREFWRQYFAGCGASQVVFSRV